MKEERERTETSVLSLTYSSDSQTLKKMWFNTSENEIRFWFPMRPFESEHKAALLKVNIILPKQIKHFYSPLKVFNASVQYVHI